MNQLLNEEETDNSTLHFSPSLHTDINMEDCLGGVHTVENDTDIKPDTDELHNASWSTAEMSNSTSMQDNTGTDNRSDFGGLQEPKLDIVPGTGTEIGDGVNFADSEPASHEEMTPSQTPHPQLVMAHSPFCDSEAKQWHAVTVYDENVKDAASQPKHSPIDLSLIASSSTNTSDKTAENLPSKAGRFHNLITGYFMTKFHLILFLSKQNNSEI